MHRSNQVRTRYPGPIQTPAVYSHGLDAPEFSSDAALAAMLDRYPRDLFDINHFSFDAEGQASLKTGERGDLSGAQLLEAIRRGELWVNLRFVEKGWPELWAAAMDAFDDVAANYAGLNAVKRSGQLIISSPRTKVPYHFDAAGVMLFHMRGTKRIFIYPGDEQHLPEEAMEDIVARQRTEDLPYQLSFEQDAQVIDLIPGEVVAWPLYAPHRVENLDSFCVSLSVDYQTWSSRIRTGALYTHAVMRRRGLTPRATDRMGPFNLAMRWGASVMLRRAGVLEERIRHIEREFVPDAHAADGVRRL